MRTRQTAAADIRPPSVSRLVSLPQAERICCLMTLQAVAVCCALLLSGTALLVELELGLSRLHLQVRRLSGPRDSRPPSALQVLCQPGVLFLLGKEMLCPLLQISAAEPD